MLQAAKDEVGAPLNGHVTEPHVRQAEQQLQIDAISFLLKTYIPWPELGHLWGLKLDKPFPFTKSQWFEAELRRLRSLGVIKGKPGVSVGQLPEDGDLKDFFEITHMGVRYLEFRQRFSDLRSELDTEQP